MVVNAPGAPSLSQVLEADRESIKDRQVCRDILGAFSLELLSKGNEERLAEFLKHPDKGRGGLGVFGLIACDLAKEEGGKVNVREFKRIYETLTRCVSFDAPMDAPDLFPPRTEAQNYLRVNVGALAESGVCNGIEGYIGGFLRLLSQSAADGPGDPQTDLRIVFDGDYPGVSGINSHLQLPKIDGFIISGDFHKRADLTIMEGDLYILGGAELGATAMADVIDIHHVIYPQNAYGAARESDAWLKLTTDEGPITIREGNAINVQATADKTPDDKRHEDAIDRRPDVTTAIHVLNGSAYHCNFDSDGPITVAGDMIRTKVSEAGELVVGAAGYIGQPTQQWPLWSGHVAQGNATNCLIRNVEGDFTVEGSLTNEKKSNMEPIEIGGDVTVKGVCLSSRVNVGGAFSADGVSEGAVVNATTITTHSAGQVTLTAVQTLDITEVEGRPETGRASGSVLSSGGGISVMHAVDSTLRAGGNVVAVSVTATPGHKTHHLLEAGEHARIAGNIERMDITVGGRLEAQAIIGDTPEALDAKNAQHQNPKAKNPEPYYVVTVGQRAVVGEHITGVYIHGDQAEVNVPLIEHCGNSRIGILETLRVSDSVITVDEAYIGRMEVMEGDVIPSYVFPQDEGAVVAQSRLTGVDGSSVCYIEGCAEGSVVQSGTVQIMEAQETHITGENILVGGQSYRRPIRVTVEDENDFSDIRARLNPNQNGVPVIVMSGGSITGTGEGMAACDGNIVGVTVNAPAHAVAVNGIIAFSEGCTGRVVTARGALHSDISAEENIAIEASGSQLGDDILPSLMGEHIDQRMVETIQAVRAFSLRYENEMQHFFNAAHRLGYDPADASPATEAYRTQLQELLRRYDADFTTAPVVMNEIIDLMQARAATLVFTEQEQHAFQLGMHNMALLQGYAEICFSGGLASTYRVHDGVRGEQGERPQIRITQPDGGDAVRAITQQGVGAHVILHQAPTFLKGVEASILQIEHGDVNTTGNIRLQHACILDHPAIGEGTLQFLGEAQELNVGTMAVGYVYGAEQLEIGMGRVGQIIAKDQQDLRFVAGGHVEVNQINCYGTVRIEGGRQVTREQLTQLGNVNQPVDVANMPLPVIGSINATNRVEAMGTVVIHNLSGVPEVLGENLVIGNVAEPANTQVVFAPVTAEVEALALRGSAGSGRSRGTVTAGVIVQNTEGLMQGMDVTAREVDLGKAIGCRLEDKRLVAEATELMARLAERVPHDIGSKFKSPLQVFKGGQMFNRFTSVEELERASAVLAREMGLDDTRASHRAAAFLYAPTDRLAAALNVEHGVLLVHVLEEISAIHTEMKKKDAVEDPEARNRKTTPESLFGDKVEMGRWRVTAHATALRGGNKEYYSGLADKLAELTPLGENLGIQGLLAVAAQATLRQGEVDSFPLVEFLQGDYTHPIAMQMIGVRAAELHGCDVHAPQVSAGLIEGGAVHTAGLRAGQVNNTQMKHLVSDAPTFRIVDAQRIEGDLRDIAAWCGEQENRNREAGVYVPLDEIQRVTDVLESIHHLLMLNNEDQSQAIYASIHVKEAIERLYERQRDVQSVDTVTATVVEQGGVGMSLLQQGDVHLIRAAVEQALEHMPTHQAGH